MERSLVCVAFLLLLVGSTGSAGAQVIERVSVSSTGEQGNGESRPRGDGGRRGDSGAGDVHGLLLVRDRWLRQGYQAPAAPRAAFASEASSPEDR